MPTKQISHKNRSLLWKINQLHLKTFMDAWSKTKWKKCKHNRITSLSTVIFIAQCIFIAYENIYSSQCIRRGGGKPRGRNRSLIFTTFLGLNNDNIYIPHQNSTTGLIFHISSIGPTSSPGGQHDSPTYSYINVLLLLLFGHLSI
jgi:hypothetical protein